MTNKTPVLANSRTKYSVCNQNANKQIYGKQNNDKIISYSSVIMCNDKDALLQAYPTSNFMLIGFNTFVVYFILQSTLLPLTKPK